MKKLVQKKCVPCEGGVKPLSRTQVTAYSTQLPRWSASKDLRRITREYRFKNFTEAVVFITEVAQIAEEEGHHPDLNLHDYSRVTITLSTHAIKGLSENDFILAAKIDQIG